MPEVSHMNVYYTYKHVCDHRVFQSWQELQGRRRSLTWGLTSSRTSTQQIKLAVSLQRREWRILSRSIRTCTSQPLTFFFFLYISNMMNSLKLKQYMLFILKTTKVVVNELILTHIRQRMAEWNQIRLFFNWNVWNFAFPPFSIYLFRKE